MDTLSRLSIMNTPSFVLDVSLMLKTVAPVLWGYLCQDNDHPSLKKITSLSKIQ